MKSNRESNLELLRIISMILIVAHHFALNINYDFGQNIFWNRSIVDILSVGGKIGVNCFVLISGFYMVKSKFKIKKLINLMIEVLFYSLFGILMAKFFTPNVLNIKNIVKAIFPITYGEYWFMSAYVIVYMLSPFINEIIRNIKKNSLENLIVILMLVEVFIPTISASDFQYSSIIWFITLYLIGAYISIYKKFNDRNICAIVGMGSYAIIVISIILFEFIGTKIKIISQHTTYFTKINTIFCVLASIGIFLYFKNIKVFHNGFINNVSSTTLGIYLIHDNKYIRPIIWNNIINAKKYIDEFYFLGYSIISILIVFIVCAFIERIRQLFFNKLIFKLSNKIEEIVVKIIKRTIKLKYKLLNNSKVVKGEK